MRTTIDIPDDLFRKAKSTAALRGLKLKEFLTQVIEQGLEPTQQVEMVGQKRPIPVTISVELRSEFTLNNEDIENILIQEDTAKIGFN